MILPHRSFEARTRFVLIVCSALTWLGAHTWFDYELRNRKASTVGPSISATENIFRSQKWFLEARRHGKEAWVGIMPYHSLAVKQKIRVDPLHTLLVHPDSQFRVTAPSGWSTPAWERDSGEGRGEA